MGQDEGAVRCIRIGSMPLLSVCFSFSLHYYYSDTLVSEKLQENEIILINNSSHPHSLGIVAT
jgi:hypothetical protein